MGPGIVSQGPTLTYVDLMLYSSVIVSVCPFNCPLLSQLSLSQCDSCVALVMLMLCHHCHSCHHLCHSCHHLCHSCHHLCHSCHHLCHSCDSSVTLPGQDQLSSDTIKFEPYAPPPPRNIGSIVPTDSISSPSANRLPVVTETEETMPSEGGPDASAELDVMQR